MTKFNKSKAGKAAAAVAVISLLSSGMAANAQADTLNTHHPETPKTNVDLPIVNTYRGSDHIKANILNPRPVCNSAEDFRTVVYKVKDDFTPAGTISATNQTANPIPLKQDLSKSQSISLSIKGDRTETTSVNVGGTGNADGGSISTGVAWSLAKTLGFQASYSLSWEVGQSLGPYDVPTGYTGEATYGFRTISMTGTQQFCKPNGTWSTPTAWSALTPVKNQVNVKLYKNAAGAADGAPIQDPADDSKDIKDQDGAKPEDVKTEEKPAPSTETEPEKAAEAEKTAGKSETVELKDEKGKEGEEGEAQHSEEDTKAPEGEEGEKAPEGEESEAPEGEEGEEGPEGEEAGQEDYDLKPYLQVSGAKADGYAGLVAIKLKNVGKKRYFQEYPLTTFRVEVKTDKGPKGVDRLITPGSFNGGHIYDEGYDFEKSTRAFKITLANPVNPGETITVGNLNFGDGDTREGRLHNYVTVTQTSRHNEDKSEANDQNVDSREHTVTDTGKKHNGIF